MHNKRVVGGGMMHRRFFLYFTVMVAMLALALLGTRGPAAARPRAAVPYETIPPNATPLFLPVIVVPLPTPTVLPRVYASVPVGGGSLDRPAQNNPDVNLALRGYVPVSAYQGLVNYGGDTDADAPQIAPMFSPPRLPVFVGVDQVYDWNWGCNPPDGCRGDPITHPYNVTLLELATTPGEPVAIPARGPQIYAGNFKAMVLYADAGRITVSYTRDDTPAIGYLVHVEDVAVAPELVALYQQLDAAGRHRLPALRDGEALGMADRSSVKVVVRDTGMFMDPRSCKDWWTGYMSACTMQLRRPPAP